MRKINVTKNFSKGWEEWSWVEIKSWILSGERLSFPGLVRNVPPRQSHIFWKIVRGMGLNICWSNTIQTLSLSVKGHSKYIILGRSITVVNQTCECSYISCFGKYSKTVTYLSNVMLWNICALIVCYKNFKPLIPRNWWSLSPCGMLVMCIRDHEKDIQRI